MKREYLRWYSQRLHRDMELLIFGHSGAKVLMFPTRDGRFFEYEELGLVGSLADKLEAGHLQLYCIEGAGQRDLLCGRASSRRSHSPACRFRRVYSERSAAADGREKPE